VGVAPKHLPLFFRKVQPFLGVYGCSHWQIPMDAIGMVAKPHVKIQ
jgi:hypothetical protein